MPRLLRVGVPAALLLIACPARSVAQETDPPARPDSLAADSVRVEGDSLVGPLETPLQGVLADSAEDDRYAHLVLPPDLPTGAGSTVVADWDLDAILRSNALTLLELLQEMSDVTPVRGLFFGGPAHALTGVFGPGFLTVRVNGREATPMDGGQPDLTRYSLASLQRVRVLRTATGHVLELTTLSRDRKEAYSRVVGGTGDPGLSRLQLVYDNGLGRSFRAAAAAGLLDVESDPGSSDFDFWMNLEWVPREDGSGLALEYRNEAMERELYGTDDIGRSELVLRGRLALGDALLLEAHGGRTGWSNDALTEEPSSDRTATSGGVGLTGRWEAVWFRTELGAWGGKAWPTVKFEADAGVRLLGRLHLDGGGTIGTWEDFGTSEVRAGLGLDLPLGLTVRAGAAAGTRGVPDPARERADSLEFDALNGRLDFRGGLFHLWGVAERQSLDRQLPFGAPFDRFQAAGGPADVTALEGGGDVPILPLSWISGELGPLRARGFFRYNSWEADQEILYLPQYLARGEVAFDEEFFEGNLAVRLGFGVNHRSSMRTASADAPTTETDETAAVPAYTFLDWNLGIRVKTVLIYFRYDNSSRQPAADLPGLDFPVTRSVFGVKWEFLD